MIDKMSLAKLSYPAGSPIPAALERVVVSWSLFTRLKQEEKGRYSLPQFETDWGDPGYFRKYKENSYDSKELFHHIPGMETFYHMMGVQEFDETFQRFISEANKLSLELSSYLSSDGFSGFISDKILEKKLKEVVRRSLSLLTIRFLNYDPGPIGQGIAKDHVDKTGMAISLYSSHPGLQIDPTSLVGPRNGKEREWSELDVPSREFVVWGGHQLNLWSNSRVRPLTHRVLSMTTDSRQSIVAFLPLFGVPRLAKDVRMQDLMDHYGY